VLAHAACNGDKRDLLAAKCHLEKWAARNHRYKEEIGGNLSGAGFNDDLTGSKMIARWAYRQAVGGHAWVQRRGRAEIIDEAYLFSL
jgi:hypothetical protein